MFLFSRNGHLRWAVWILGCLVLPVTAYAAEPKADVSLGYSHLGKNALAPGAGSLSGWEGALNVGVARFMGIEADVARYGMGADASRPHSTLVLFGPRLTAGTAGVHLFAHALAGGAHSSNDRGYSHGALAGELGVGGDVRIFPGFAWRLSVDHLGVTSGAPAGASHTRITTGIVFRF